MQRDGRKKSNTRSYLLASALFLYLFYYSYRYVLKYNSEGTSPTYAETPFAIQMLKYVLLAGILLCMFLSVFNKNLSGRHKIPLFLIGFLILQNIYAFFVTSSINSLIAIMCLLPAFPILAVSEEIDIEPMKNVLNVFLYFTIFYEFVQIILFATKGRLPALGWATGKLTDVRFGGAWDDPNGFALLLSFYLPYTFYSFRGFKRGVLLLILFVFLILTWSMTGIVAFFAVWMVCIIAKISKIKFHFSLAKFLGGIAAFVVLCIGLAAVTVYFWDYIVFFLQAKQESIQQHLEGWKVDLSFGLLSGLQPNGERPEPSMIALINHGGILHMLIFYGLGIYGLQCALKNCRSTDKNKNPLFEGIAFYQACFLLVSLNLPFAYAFSNFGIYVLFLALSLFFKERELLQSTSLADRISLKKRGKTA